MQQVTVTKTKVDLVRQGKASHLFSVKKAFSRRSTVPVSSESTQLSQFEGSLR